MDYIRVVDGIGVAIDTIGVGVIAIGVALSISFYIASFLHREQEISSYKTLRINLARTILLGLEFLVAGDVIRSIATPPTLMTVVVLAIIVLIRSFLSIQFEKETEGFYPWEKRKQASSHTS